MRTRQLGRTGLAVSPLGLGLAALGRPAYITKNRAADLGDDRSAGALEQRCHAMLDAAFEAGIRYVDAARSYGLAEEFLARWFERRGAGIGDVVVGSKWGYTYVGAWQMHAAVHERKDLSLDALTRQHAESRALLGDRLRLYQIHSATVDSGVLDDRHVLAELARLRSGGLSIGLSVTGPGQAATIRRALGVTVDGVNPFQTVQATWNLLETSAAPALAEAHAQGWGVIVKEALANGRLAAIDAIALGAALANRWADVVLSGAVTPDQLRRGVAALDLAERGGEWPSMAEDPKAYWSSRGSLPWK